MTPFMRKKLIEAGWVIECESPLELHHPETGSFATGIAADLVAATTESEALEDEEDEEDESPYVGGPFVLIDDDYDWDDDDDEPEDDWRGDCDYEDEPDYR